MHQTETSYFWLKKIIQPQIIDSKPLSRIVSNGEPVVADIVSNGKSIVADIVSNDESPVRSQPYQRTQDSVRDLNFEDRESLFLSLINSKLFSAIKDYDSLPWWVANAMRPLIHELFDFLDRHSKWTPELSDMICKEFFWIKKVPKKERYRWPYLEFSGRWSYWDALQNLNGKYDDFRRTAETMFGYKWDTIEESIKNLMRSDEMRAHSQNEINSQVAKWIRLFYIDSRWWYNIWPSKLEILSTVETVLQEEFTALPKFRIGFD